MITSTNPPKTRDERLDFFRGLTMFIIFVAHADINPLNGWIPARFGFSSGAEVFVFCSGFASALAFGSVFAKRGFFLGFARVLYRIWQVYWAHICSALVVFAIMIAAQQLYPAHNLHVEPVPQLIAAPLTAIMSLITLRWLPDYLDILPMYLVLLTMIPAMMFARRCHPSFPFLISLALYSLVWISKINLSGNPWTGQGWFFNPFAWQLIFFCGFAFSSGWLPAPRLRDQRLMILCLVILLVSVPLTFWGIHEIVPSLRTLSSILLSEDEKTNLHPFRFIHFLAFAYVALSLIDPYRHRLLNGASRIIIGVGQQSLAVFLSSLVFARLASIIFQLFGTDFIVASIINLIGAIVIISTAVIARWFKSSPWRNTKIAKDTAIMTASIPATKATPA